MYADVFLRIETDLKMRTILAATAVAVTLLTGCSTGQSPLPVSPAPQMSGSGSGGNTGPIPTGTTGGSGGSGGTYGPYNLLACTEVSPCSGSGGNPGPVLPR